MRRRVRDLPSEAVIAGRWLVVVALTGVGVSALELWLALVGGVPPLSRPVAVGVVVLMAGMQVVHFLTDLAVNGVEVGFPLGATLVVSVTEAVLWSGWLAVAGSLGGVRGLFVGGVAFAVALSVQHTVETNVLRKQPLGFRLFDPATVGFSLVTAAGATAWLSLNAPVPWTEPFADSVASLGFDAGAVGVAALGVALLAERVLIVRMGRSERARSTIRRYRDRVLRSRTR